MGVLGVVKASFDTSLEYHFVSLWILIHNNVMAGNNWKLWSGKEMLLIVKLMNSFIDIL